MPSYIPVSDEILFQDPEKIDDCHGWQQFADFLKQDRKINTQERRKKLQRYNQRQTTFKFRN